MNQSFGGLFSVPDFLPSFGPCFINFYGTSDTSNTHRLSIKTQHIGSTIDKVQVGDDYKV